MPSQAKKLIALAVVVASFAVGFVLGRHDGSRRADEALATSASALFGTVAMKEYREGDPASAERALLGYVEVLNAVETEESAATLSTDRTLAWARLARVRRHAGDPTGAREAMATALQNCNAERGLECTETSIEEMLSQLDNGAPFLAGG